jgi:hypothetical protein
MLIKAVSRRGLAVGALAIGLGAACHAALAAEPSPTAVWAPRKVHIVFRGTCDQTYDLLRATLLRLGARARDLDIDERTCPAPNGAARLDASFSVLVPVDAAAGSVAGAAVEAHWQTLELKGNCVVIAYFTRTLVPLFSTRNVKLVPKEMCETLHVGLRAELLQPAQESANSR